MKGFIQTLIVGLATIAFGGAAFAHVIVTPGQVGVGQELTFNVSVPNERTTPVTSVKLDIPDGVTSVVPTEKPGWTITTQQSNNTITAITWTGSMPVGLRDDFSFSAQVPANPTELDWKAYQTYGDGTVVHWDQQPAGSDDSTGDAGPYSVTQVVDDIGTPTASGLSASTTADIALGVGIVALFVAVFAALRRR